MGSRFNPNQYFRIILLSWCCFWKFSMCVYRRSYWEKTDLSNILCIIRYCHLCNQLLYYISLDGWIETYLWSSLWHNHSYQLRCSNRNSLSQSKGKSWIHFDFIIYKRKIIFSHSLLLLFRGLQLRQLARINTI